MGECTYSELLTRNRYVYCRLWNQALSIWLTGWQCRCWCCSNFVAKCKIRHLFPVLVCNAKQLRLWPTFRSEEPASQRNGSNGSGLFHFTFRKLLFSWSALFCMGLGERTLVTRKKQPKRGGVCDEQQHVKASPELRGCRDLWPCQTHTNPNTQKSRSWLAKATSIQHQPLGLYNPNQGSRSCCLQRLHEHAHTITREGASWEIFWTPS